MSRFAVAAILWLLASVCSAQEPEERHYRMLISGQEAGWMVERRTVEDGLLVTESTMRLDVARGGTAIRMELEERFVETLEHVPVSMRVTQRLGSAPVRTDYVFDGDGIRVEGSQGVDRRPAPSGSWSTPGEVESILSRRVASVDGSDTEGEPASRFRLRILEPLIGLDPVKVRYELESAEDAVEIGGESVSASRWRMIQSYAPATPSTVWLSEDGEMLRSEARMMGLEVVTVLAAEPLATDAATGASAADLPEILVQTFVHPDRVIEEPRRARRGVYRLRAAGVDLAKLVPETAAQRVEALAPEDADEASSAGLRVVVDLDAPGGSEGDGEAAGEPAERFLAATNYVDHEHPAVRALLQAGAKADPVDADVPNSTAAPGSSERASPAARAEELRRLVVRHLRSKDLGTALGTAGQAAASRSGDCTEHAVLLAALLRAEGIPSRVAIGLIYAERFAGREDLFGYHMWTQAFGGGRWIDLDATLGPETPFDATHLLFGTDALDGDGVPLLSTGLEGLMGRLEIAVESVSADDPTPDSIQPM